MIFSILKEWKLVESEMFGMAKQIEISTEYITLGQFLKLADVIQSGGMAKFFIAETDIFVNGELEKRRGKKLRQDDVIDIPAFGEFIVKA